MASNTSHKLGRKGSRCASALSSPAGGGSPYRSKFVQMSTPWPCASCRCSSMSGARYPVHQTACTHVKPLPPLPQARTSRTPCTTDVQ